jgi:hypothetical protein
MEARDEKQRIVELELQQVRYEASLADGATLPAIPRIADRRM